MAELSFDQVYPLIVRSARAHATAAVVNGSVIHADRPDLEQEGVVACWRALPRFDPKRAGLRTYFERVIRSRSISLHRARLRRPATQYLATETDVAGSDYARSMELSIDVRRVLSRLTQNERHLAVALAEDSAIGASRKLRVSRSTVYERMTTLQRVFSEAGLHP